MDGYSKPIFKFALREDLKDNKEFLPTRGEPKASGWDVRAAFKNKESMVIKPFQHVRIPLGFRAFCQEGYWYELKPRSSSFAKKNLHALYGTIDETYENELVFACQYIPDLKLEFDKYQKFLMGEDTGNLIINFGEAIGQIIPVRRQEMAVYEVSNEEYDSLCQERDGLRKTGGFGSTDGK